MPRERRKQQRLINEQEEPKQHQDGKSQTVEEITLKMFFGQKLQTVLRNS